MTGTNYTLLYIVLAIIVLGAIIAGVFLVIKKKRESFVLDHSQKIPKIIKLNNSAQFYSIPATINLQKDCNSKREYDRFDPYDYLTTLIANNREYYFDIITKVSKNQKLYNTYCVKFSQILQEEIDTEKEYYRKYSFFREAEQRLCNTKKLTPVIDVCVRITKSYYSAKGRNAYKAHWDLYLADLLSCYNAAGQAEIHRQSAKYQRELMTDSLRYDVMKRDGFKCVICGASAQDGARLHVDHIFPVSKGGKTELSNLRTLCDRCNLGKSAKYDPYGLN